MLVHDAQRGFDNDPCHSAMQSSSAIKLSNWLVILGVHFLIWILNVDFQMEAQNLNFDLDLLLEENLNLNFENKKDPSKPRWSWHYCYQYHNMVASHFRSPTAVKGDVCSLVKAMAAPLEAWDRKLTTHNCSKSHRTTSCGLIRAGWMHSQSWNQPTIKLQT